MLINNGVNVDWSGRIWGKCQDCAGLTDADFRRKAKHSWNQRSREVKGKAKRARTIDYDNALEHMKELFPEANKKVLRKLAVKRLRAFAVRFCESVDEATPEFHEAAVRITKDDLEHGELAANDESFQTPVHGGSLAAKEAAWLTEVCKGISVAFLCRRPE